jgi:hypothetical protein
MEMLVILFLALVAIPALLVFISIKLWRSKRALFRWLALIPVAVLTFMSLQIYWALYPREEFYRAEWLQQTGFPLAGKVVFRSKSATYPDQHGDYWAGAVMEVSPTDLLEMERRLLAHRDFSLDTSMQRIGITQDFLVLLGDLRVDPLDAVYKADHLWIRVAFLKKHGVVDSFFSCKS